jgi:large subunit ribosomal protein L4
MKLDIHKIDGSTSGKKIDLADSIYGIEPNDHAIYLSVKAYLANQRQGTHKAKERKEVRGGGRKPWRQKGRGTARAGTTRSREVTNRSFLKKLNDWLANQHLVTRPKINSC